MPDGTYLYHDHIQNHQLGLGSYYYDSQILAKIQGSGDGSFKDSDNITIALEFNEQVIVTGTPRLKLETGQNDRHAKYIFGSGSNTLIFSYIVQSGDVSEDLDYQSKNALELNSGTIKDLVGNSANLILPATGAENSLAQIQSILVNYTLALAEILTVEVGNLEWQYKTTLKASQADGIAYCNELDLKNHSDWRLPSLNELKTLYVQRSEPPHIIDALYPETILWPYWSSDYKTPPETNYEGEGWNYRFHVGDYSNSSWSGDQWAVRCVRNL